MVESDNIPFDPLAVENVGVTLAVQFISQPINPMPPSTSFRGAGVYAIYYVGKDAAYRSLSRLDKGRCRFPVYVGKAVRENAKQGFNPQPARQARLYNRISEHAESMSHGGLNLAECRCRYLVLNDAYISLAESVMIRVFRPPWNGMGFGSKVVGGRRMEQVPSLWDSLHQGRSGRPLGTATRRAQAIERLDHYIDELQKEIQDPTLQEMHRKIMRYFET